jgi:gliding motility-associated-like protein
VIQDFTIISKPFPVVTMNPSNGIICPGGFVTLSCSEAGNYSWYGPGGAYGSNQQTITVNTPGMYYCILTDNAGCVFVSNTVEVKQYNTPYLIAIPGTVICPGGSTTLKAITNAGSIIDWQPPLSGNSPVQTVSVAGTYFCNITSCGILTQVSIVITQSTLTANITSGGPLSFCTGDSVTLDAIGGSSYLWSTGDTTQSITVTTPGNYTVTVADNTGCTNNSAPNLVTVYPLPAVIISVIGPATVCPGDSTILAADGAASYIWSNGLGTGDTITVHPASTTAYTVTGTLGGCSNTAAISINIYPLPLITILPDTSFICAGGSDTLFATGANDYVWTPATGLDTTMGSTVIASPSNSITYTVTGTGSNNCTNTAAVVVTIHPPPAILFTADPSIGCAPLAASFDDNSTPAISTWLWNFGDTVSGIYNSDTIKKPTHIYSSAGTYSVTLSVITAGNCSGNFTNSSMVNVYPKPVADFYWEPDSVSIFEQFNFIDQSLNSYYWNWNFGDPFTPSNTSALQNPDHTYNTDGFYTVRLDVTSDHGCTDTIEKNILIKQEFRVIVPNAFTPNGDGTNDYFMPQGIGWDESTFEMYIFDRWGGEIYSTRDINKPWNGRYNNGTRNVPQGVYVCRIMVKNLAGIRKYNQLHIVTLVR